MKTEKNGKIFKLGQFSVWSEGSDESNYGEKPKTVEDLMKEFQIKIIAIDEENMELEFDMIGVGPPIANAIRRILLAEIPTMAIDKINLYNNTTVIPDEVLVHRVGLVPIKVDPRLFVSKVNDDEGTEEDTIQFELKIHYKKELYDSLKSKGSEEFSKRIDANGNFKVLSDDLKFVPIGNQKELYEDIRPVHSDILLAILKKGHEIDLKAFCYKNIGREHAKFSPVAVASYRLHPHLRLLKRITGERANTLAKCFPEGVIKISKKDGEDVAKVSDARRVKCSRNVFLHEELKNDVEISTVNNHYIFTVESAGALAPEVLVPEAINILKEKCRFFLSELKALKM